VSGLRTLKRKKPKNLKTFAKKLHVVFFSPGTDRETDTQKMQP